MKHRKRGPTLKPRAAKILVFGENLHDTKALRFLMEAINPALSRKIQLLREPIVLNRNAQTNSLRTNTEKIVEVVAAMRTTYDVPCYFLHQDCDDFEPGHIAATQRLEAAHRSELVNRGIVECTAHPVIPAWEIEAWWFLWPEATQSINPSWRIPDDYRGKHVGKIRDAKQELNRCLKPTGQQQKRIRDYQEADSPDIAEAVLRRKAIDQPEKEHTQSGSFEDFKDRVRGVTVP